LSAKFFMTMMYRAKIVGFEKFNAIKYHLVYNFL